MFIEPNLKGERRGWIEVICGSMFSGKTEELIRRLKRVKIANLKVEIFKPAIDVRYDETKIVSHDTNAIISTPVDNSQSILLLARDVDVVGIDEAQFFDAEIANVCEQLAQKGIRVIVKQPMQDISSGNTHQPPCIRFFRAIDHTSLMEELHIIFVIVGLVGF